MSTDFDLDRLDAVQLVPPSPFSPDGRELLTDVLEGFLGSMSEAGIRVVLPAAGTGEFHSLSATEVVASVRAARRALGRDGIVLAPIGLGLGHAIEVGRGAIEAGADALLVMPPVHPYLSDSGLRDYFVALMEELPRPFLAYKKGPVPGDELLAELAETGRLVGVKYAVNDLNAFAMFAANRGRLGLYCGTAERFAPYFHLAGARGYTSGAGNLAPRLTLAIHRDLSEGRYASAMERLAILRPIEDYRARGGDSYNISMLKSALRSSGYDFGPPRPPQRRISAEEGDEIGRLLEPILAAERELAR